MSGTSEQSAAVSRTGGAPSSHGRPIRWSGPRVFLVECASLAEVVALHARLAADPLPGQVEALAAAETVAVAFTDRRSAVAGAETVRHLDVAASDLTAGTLVEIEVVYDGEDLEEVGALTGLGSEGLVRWHTDTEWVGAFGGFAPGFTYVAPADPCTGLDISRRTSPRTSVPAGSVALAGAFSAVYPRMSPGGWQLIGRTGATLWDLGRDLPALVSPGDRVRYRAVREQLTVRTAGGGAAEHRSPTPAPTDAPAAPGVLVVQPGLQSLLQDLGRTGSGDLGVPAAGAADAASSRQANRIVGNTPEAAVIETLLGGLTLRARGHHVLALSGAEGPADITAVDRGRRTDNGTQADRRAPRLTPFALYDGEVLTIGEPEAGLRTYVAVRGGFDAVTELGSRSTDTLSGLGPAPLAAGTEVPVRSGAGGAGVGIATVGSAELPLRAMPRTESTTVLRVIPGPRDDWFGPAGLERLTGQDWRVCNQSNRIGVRLEIPDGLDGPDSPDGSDRSDGAPLERIREGELASEGAVIGALQVPPSGLPVLFLADHPVTGGYPVIGVVVPRDLTLAAQLPPGAVVRFEIVDPDMPDLPDMPDAPDYESPTRED